MYINSNRTTNNKYKINQLYSLSNNLIHLIIFHILK